VRDATLVIGDEDRVREQRLEEREAGEEAGAPVGPGTALFSTRPAYEKQYTLEEGGGTGVAFTTAMSWARSAGENGDEGGSDCGGGDRTRGAERVSAGGFRGGDGSPPALCGGDTRARCCMRWEEMGVGNPMVTGGLRTAERLSNGKAISSSAGGRVRQVL
jgi:hypothetical protein